MDGRVQPIEAPALGARDRGFLYGEAVYESVLVVGRRPLFLARHLDRLADSAQALDLEAGWTVEEARSALGRLLGDRADGVARFYRTAGDGTGGPVSLAWIDPRPAAAGAHTPPWRLACHRERIVPYLPRVKHTHKLAHARARRVARDRGFDDAILVHADGWALEGSASNLLFFESDTLHTPALECGVLPGITRDVVLELAPGCGFRVVEGRYPPAIVAAADECLVTYTSGGVVGVTAIEETVLPGSAPGPRTRRLAAAYEARVAEALAAEAPL